MRIAICDDDQEDIEYLEKLILESEFRPADVEILRFYKGEDLLTNFSKFNLIFLDIKLDGMSGTRAADAIRLQDPIVAIVFYTNYDVQASRVMKVRPIHYLIKGRKLEEHKKDINDIFQKVCGEEELPRLFVNYCGKMYVLPLSDIVYISILDKGTAIWLGDEKRKEIFGEIKKNQDPSNYIIKSGVKLETYYEQLKEYGFIYAKKSYIVNSKFVTGRFKDSITLTGGYELTVARSKKKMVDDLLVEYWGEHTIGG